MIRCRSMEDALLRSRGDNLLVVSSQQLQFKRLSIQANEMAVHFPAVNKAALEFVRSLDILDRSFSRKLALIVATSALYKYESDKPLREEGEKVAAALIIAFVKMILVRKRYRQQSKT